MEETDQERRRRSARERKRRERARQSPSKAAAARTADAQRRRWALLHETEYQRELRRRRERLRQRLKRLLATPEEIEERRKRERETTAERRKHWTPEEKEEKRRRDRERNAYKRFMQQQNPDGPNLDNDSWIAATAAVSSENFLTHEDEFLLPSKLQKKLRKKRRRAAAKSAKSGEKHESQLKKMVVVANHQHFVMSNLSSLWKNRKLCDAGIGNGTSTIRVHKVVLSAVCPKLLSVISTDILSQKFLQVNFPEEVSTKALNAFAEYMYNGTLDLDIEILKQLKIIAKNLDIKEFEELCDDYLPNAQVIEVKHEISATERAQVEKDTAAAFGEESDATSSDPKKAGNADDISPNTETGPDNNKYDNLSSSSSSNQVLTSTTSPSSLSTPATTAAAAVAEAASTPISSVPASSTEFAIPFSQSTDGKSTKLKPTPSYEPPLVSDLSPVSHIGETVCSQSSAMNEDSSKQLNRQSISTSSLQLQSTSPNNAGMYPVGPFTSTGDNQGFTRATNVGAVSPHSQATAMKGFSSTPLNRQSITTSSIQLPSTSPNNEGIYSVGHFTASGDNQGFTRSTNVGTGSPHSQATAMKGFSSKPLNRQPISTSSIQLPSTSNNNDGIYPGGHFTASGDNQGFTRSTNVGAAPAHTPKIGPGSPHSQPTAMKGFSSKPLNRQSISTSSIQHPSNNNDGIYPGGHFTASGDNQGFMRYRNVGAGSPHSQSTAMKGFPSKPLNRQSMSTSSIQLPSTSTTCNNESLYPVGPFTASGDNQGFMCYRNVGAGSPHSQSTAMKGFPSKPLSRQSMSTSSIQLPSTSTNNDSIYPVGPFAASGDNQSFARYMIVGAAPAHTPKIGAGFPYAPHF